MARKRKAKARAAVVVAAREPGEARDGGTPETVRKQVRGAIAVLIERHAVTGGARGLDPACGQAATEIAAVYIATTAGLWPRTTQFGERIRGASAAEWSAHLLAANKRYCRWLEMPLQARRAGSGEVRDVVLDAAVDGLGVRQIAERRAMDQRTVEKVLRESLEAYAVMAGWMRKPVVADAA